MKKYIMAAIAAVAIMPLFTSCSEDETVKMSTEDGAPIRFSATTKAAKDSRTSYSTEMKNGKWDLYWVSNDQVKIFCPEANTQGTNENVATYTVVSTDASAKVTKYALDGNGLHWGAEDEHHFYEAYPSKNVSEITATNVTATIPSTQNAKLQADGYYADMDAALMAGYTSCLKSEVETDGLDIPFAPIFTAVDITVSASTNKDFELTSITVANSENALTTQQPLAGKFTYTFGAPEGSKFASVTADEDYNVQLEFETPIKLSNNTSNEGTVKEVKATVFLRGDFTNAVKVVLNGKDISSVGSTLVQLKKQGAAGDKLTALARNHVTLGSLPTEQFKPMTGEWWVSHMHNDTYVSQMSLPGVYDAANFMDLITGDDRAQTHLFTSNSDRYYQQMAAYLNAGNRVFDFKPTYYKVLDGPWYDRDREFHYEWYNDRVPNLGQNPEKTDYERMVNATIQWLAKHTTEFIVFILSDNEHTEDLHTTYGYSSENYYNHAMEIINLIPNQYRLDSFGPDVTVEEARGKILVINGTPCKDAIGLNVPKWKFNKKVTANLVDPKNDSYFENDGTSYDMVSVNDATKKGKLWVEDFNNGANHNDNTLNKKDSYINNSIDKAKVDDNINNWYITSTAFRHWAGAGDYTYGDARTRFQTTAIRKINTLSSTEYEKCGIILQAYAGQTVTIDGNTYSLEDVIWANNYKANGPKKADKQ